MKLHETALKLPFFEKFCPLNVKECAEDLFLIYTAYEHFYEKNWLKIRSDIYLLFCNLRRILLIPKISFAVHFKLQFAGWRKSILWKLSWKIYLENYNIPKIYLENIFSRRALSYCLFDFTNRVIFSGFGKSSHQNLSFGFAYKLLLIKKAWA